MCMLSTLRLSCTAAERNIKFWQSVILSEEQQYSLLAISIPQGRFVNQSPLKSGLLMIINGTCAGTVAYAVGAALEVSHKQLIKLVNQDLIV